MINSYDDLPLEKTSKMYNMVILNRSNFIITKIEQPNLLRKKIIKKKKQQQQQQQQIK